MQPLGMSFQANEEMKGRGLEKEIHHEAISHGNVKSSHGNVKSSHGNVKSSHAMQNSKEQQFQGKFRALSGHLKLGKSEVQCFKWCANRS